MNRKFLTFCLALAAIILTLLSTACKKDATTLDVELSAPMESLPLDSLIVGFCCNGGESIQKEMIPGNVANQFDENFPGAYSQEWLFYNGVYGVRFELDLSAYKAIYMVDDDNITYLLAFFTNLQKFEIPATVEAAMKERYGEGWSINSAFEVQTIYHTLYELLITQRSNDAKVFFNENGGFIGSCPY